MFIQASATLLTMGLIDFLCFCDKKWAYQKVFHSETTENRFIVQRTAWLFLLSYLPGKPDVNNPEMKN